MTKMTVTKEEVTEVRSALTTKKRGIPSEGWTTDELSKEGPNSKDDAKKHASKAKAHHHPCEVHDCQVHGEKRRRALLRRA